MGRNDRCPCGSGRKYKTCCLSEDDFLARLHIPRGLVSRKWVGGVAVWEPGGETVLDIHRQLQTQLLASFRPGEYRGSDILSVLAALVQAADAMLVTQLEGLAYWGPLDLLLHQLGRWTAAFGEMSNSVQANDPVELFDFEGITSSRRSLRHLVESLCMQNPRRGWPAGPISRTFSKLERAMVLSRLAYKWSLMYDNTSRLFAESTTVGVHDSHALRFLTYHLDERAVSINDRLARDFITYKRFSASVSSLESRLFTDTVRGEIEGLDRAFEKELGFSLVAMADVLSRLLPAIKPHHTTLCPFVPEKELLPMISEFAHIDPQSARRLTAAFTLSASALQKDPPVIRKLKREHRLIRRPLVRVEHPDGPHLAWSPATLSETLSVFVWDLEKRKLPADLASPGTKSAAQDFHDSENNRFEKVVEAALTERGFRCRRGVETGSLRTASGEKLAIPDDVGEIDILALHPERQWLLIGECKNTSFAPEPMLFFEDVQEFVTRTRPKSYREKFLGKIRWLRKNSEAVTAALKLDFGLDVDCQWAVVPVMITNTPTFAAYMIEDFTCTSLASMLAALDSQPGCPFILPSEQMGTAGPTDR